MNTLGKKHISNTPHRSPQYRDHVDRSAVCVSRVRARCSHLFANEFYSRSRNDDDDDDDDDVIGDCVDASTSKNESNQTARYGKQQQTSHDDESTTANRFAIVSVCFYVCEYFVQLLDACARKTMRWPLLCAAPHAPMFHTQRRQKML